MTSDELTTVQQNNGQGLKARLARVIRLQARPLAAAALLGVLFMGALLFNLLGSQAATPFVSHEFRWAYDNGASPGDRSGMMDGPITVRKGQTGTKDPIVRLRWSLVDTSGAGVSNATVKLQYTTDDTWASGVTDISPQGSSSGKWRYRSSTYVTHDSAAATPVLSKAHNPVAGKAFEQTSDSYSHPSDRKFYENDFSLEYIGDEQETYYFRMVLDGQPVAFSSEHGNQGAIIHTEPQTIGTSNYDLHGWRWATDDATRPTDRSGGDDTAITIKRGGTGTLDPVVRLRWVIIDPSRTGLSNAKLSVQYTTQSNWSTYAYVGDQGAIGPKWRFRASPYLTQLGTTVLPRLVQGHNPLAGLQLENDALSGVNLPADNKYYEMDLSLEYTGNETATYYFRFTDNNAPMNFHSMHANQGAIINTTGVPELMSQAWRWATDDAASPTDRSGSDNAAINVKKGQTGLQDPVVRLRNVLHDHAGLGVSNASITYQYTTDDTWSTGVNEVGAPGSSSEKWRFRDSSFLTQLNNTASPLLTTSNTPLAGKALEVAAASGYNHPSGSGSYENDVSLEYIADETATWYFRALVSGVPVTFDATGNNQGPKINSLESVTPDTTITDPSGGTLTGSTKLITGTASDNSDVDKVELRIQRAGDSKYWTGATWDSASTWIDTTITSGQGTPSANWQYSWSLPSDDATQNYTIEAKAIDSALNEDPIVPSVTVQVDNTAPTINDFVVENGDPEYTLAPSVTLNNDVSGSTQMRFADSAAGLSSATYSAYGATAPYTLPSPDGTKTVYAQFKDAFGNETAAGGAGSFDSIKLDVDAPQIDYVKPDNGATGISILGHTQAAFSEANEMDPLTIDSNSYYLESSPDGASVDAIVTYSAAQKMGILHPNAPLEQNHAYIGHLTTAIKDGAGRALPSEYTWTFTTGSEKTLPLAQTGDAMINQASPDANYGNDVTMEVRSDSGANKRGTIIFDPSTIPAGATIEKAIMRVYMTTAPSANRTLNVHRLGSGWTESGVTWNSRNGADNWASGGGDFASTVDATADSGTTDGHYVTWDVTSVVSDWYGGSANDGLLIKDATEDSGTAYQTVFGTGEGTDPSTHPDIKVYYLMASASVTPSQSYVNELNSFNVLTTNTGDDNADTIHEIMVTIPAGYADIPTTPDAYTVTASSGDWQVMTAPSGTSGPQDLMLETVSSDLPDGGTVDVQFSVRAPSASGDTTWDVMSHGTEGGTRSVSDVVTVDPDGDDPYSSISQPPPGTTITGSGNFTFSGGATDDLSGVNRVELRIKNNDSNLYWRGSTSSWVSDSDTWNLADGTTSWSYDWPKPNSDNQNFTVTIEAVDDSGNRETGPTRDFNVDNVPPVPVSFAIGSGNPEYTAVTGVTLFPQATGASQMRFANTTADLSAAAYAPYATSDAYTLPAGDGTKWVFAQYQDAVGNETTPDAANIGDSIILDTTPADTSISDPTGGVLTGSTKLIAGTASDSNEISGAEVRIARSSDGWYWNGSGWQQGSIWKTANVTSGLGTPSANWEYSWTLPSSNGETTYDIEARGIDGAQNQDATPATVSVTVDNTAPDITSIFVHADNYPYTNTTDEALYLSVASATQMRFSSTQPGLATASYSAYAPTSGFALTEGDGLKRVFGQFRDAAGNETAAGILGTYDDITLDTVAPQGAMTINNDYPKANESAVYLNNDLLDPLAGILEMRFSNNSIDWSPWENFNFVKSGWDMSSGYGGSAGVGEKTVYAQFRDRAMNVTAVLSDTIELSEQQIVQPHGSYQDDPESSGTPMAAGSPGLEGARMQFGGNPSGDSTDFCKLCHDLHAAAPTSYSKKDQPFQSTESGKLLAQSQEKAVCYTCHNGTASIYNTQGDFGDNGVSEDSTRESSHPVADGTVLCSSCHTSHMEPENRDAIHRESEVIRLLKVKFTTYYGYIVSAVNTAWNDAIGDEESPGWKRLDNENEYCGACHGVESKLTGGDKLSYFTGSSHDTEVTGPASGTNIRCNKCHAWHGSDIKPLLQSTIDATTVTGNDNSVCFACHEDGNGGHLPERSVYTETAHYKVTSSTIALTKWPDSDYQAGFCSNCHESHGTAWPQMRRAEKNTLCYTCHDDASKSKPASYSYRGTSAFEATPHATDSSSNNVFSITGDAAESQEPGDCTNCHAVMGLDRGDGQPIAKMMLRDGENTCFGGSGNSGACHAVAYTYGETVDAFYSSSGSRSMNVWDAFNPTIRFEETAPASLAKINPDHDISDSDQTTYNPGAKIECTSCHNAHINRKDYDFATSSRFSDPDNLNRNWTERYTEDNAFASGPSFSATPDTDKDPTFGKEVPDFVRFCLRCHDASLPSGLSFGTPATTNIESYWGDSDTDNAEQHGRGDGSKGGIGSDRGTLKAPYVPVDGEPYAALQCFDCHESHAEEGGVYKLKSSVVINGVAMTTALGQSTFQVTDNTYGGMDGWCSFCHQIDNHASQVGSDCSSCHYHGSGDF